MRDLVSVWWVASVVLLGACVPTLVQGEPRAANTTVPDSYGGVTDAVNSANVAWADLFTDPKLKALIEAALKNNQELKIVSLEVDVAQNEIMSREGEFWPKAQLRVGSGLEKVGRYTSQGAADEANGLPNPLADYGVGLFASWEIDVWKKLRNATKAATLRYLSSIEGRKFAVTTLVSEIAATYYELVALDAQLEVVKQNIAIQRDALGVVRLQKDAARVTELAVKRFEAEVLKNQSRQYAITQRIIETEQRLNFMVGRYPQHVDRASTSAESPVPPVVHVGLPAQLLENRPDVKQAELELAAAGLDVEVAKASFYPTIEISAGVGYRAFDLLRLLTTPASLFANLAGDLMAPLFNRKGLTAQYFSANAKQKQAVSNYERAILKGYTESATQLATIENLAQANSVRAEEVARLNEASAISSGLFTSARADYVEGLMTRRDALESQMELIETRKQQMVAVVNLYRALGGGWRSSELRPQ